MAPLNIERPILIKRITITGPESTGKSTLSANLATALNTVWVPEYAREYLNQLGRPYEESDLLEIAKGQIRSEDALAKKANNYLICDTDLLVIKIWSEHKYGRCHPWILEQLAQRKYVLHILTYIDIPWEEDPLREHPDLRSYFYQRYKKELETMGVTFIEAKGDPQQRLQQSLETIHSLNSL